MKMTTWVLGLENMKMTKSLGLENMKMITRVLGLKIWKWLIEFRTWKYENDN